ncbi:MAG: hypothetical protein JW772_03830 [Candidatus Diapherotrites archaeon]|nr:hypothetical protein [Candidatus Diapherotrites archaeon]
MKNNGALGGLIAIAAIIAVSATIIASSATVHSADSLDFGNNAVEIKKNWNNLRVVLDKRTSYELAINSGFSTAGCCRATCDFTNVNTDGLGSALQNIIDTTPAFEGCSMNNFSINGGGADPHVEVTMQLKCEKTVGRIYLSYGEDVVYEKQISGKIVTPGFCPPPPAPPPAPPPPPEVCRTCGAIVADLQSGLVEYSD